MAAAPEGTGTVVTDGDERAGDNEQGQSGCGSCACGSGGCGGGGGRVPELDARPIDPALRQAAILGVLVGLVPGASAAIVTDGEPELVLMLIEQQFPGQYEIAMDEVGDSEWRTKFLRVA